MTAVAFHTLSETAAAAALVLLLATWLSEREGRPIVERWHVAVAAVSWTLPTALSWIAGGAAAGSSALLLGFLSYDLVVWFGFYLLLGREARLDLLHS